MGYFRNLTNSSFKQGNNGERLFYPWGVCGKGYILESIEQESRIRKYLSTYYIVSLLLIIIIGAFLGLWIVLVPLIPVAFILWWPIAKAVTNGLKETEIKLSIKKNFEGQFKDKDS
ncbi:MAG: hypothetical protein C4518_06365 [Desulfobacteraceae bacterium]|nr:MAG: hypothetical protein C4518_06365 [Desulfobacteraceae bacterium]